MNNKEHLKKYSWAYDKCLCGEYKCKTSKFCSKCRLERGLPEKSRVSKSYKNRLSHRGIAKKILQYYKHGKFITIWNSIHEASRLTGIHHGSISRTCNGKQKTAGGYQWHFVKS